MSVVMSGRVCFITISYEKSEALFWRILHWRLTVSRLNYEMAPESPTSMQRTVTSLADWLLASIIDG